MSNQIAHDLNAVWRSNDVKINEDKDFSSLNLNERILVGLSKAGYRIPSPVQLDAIPMCLSGHDVFVQGKTGTGKTLVFSILALTKILEADDDGLKVLIIAPTREGAFQIYDTINTIGSEIENLKCECFIGGFSFADDIPKAVECKIAVGTAGRIAHLLRDGKLKADALRLFVVDDIDEFLDKHSRPEVIDAFDTLPENIQTVVTSLTRTEEVLDLASEFLKYPYLVRYCENNVLSLLGMTHYYRVIPVDFLPVLGYRKKLEVLKEILFKVKYLQCIIFCNSVYRVDLLSTDVRYWGFSVARITKAMDQVERLQAVEMLKKNKCKVFVSTDVCSRGLDAKNVDLVIHFEVPVNSTSYLHRSGRAGRYGTKCSSITFLTKSQKNLIVEFGDDENFESHELPEPIPEDLKCDINPVEVASLPHKLLSSGCHSEETTSASSTESSKSATNNIGESCSFLTANKTEGEIANFKIVDTTNFMPDLEVIEQENKFNKDCEDTAKIEPKETCLLSPEENKDLSGSLKNFNISEPTLDSENTEAFKKEHDSKNCEDSSCELAHMSCKNKVTAKCCQENLFHSSDLKVSSNLNKIFDSSIKHDPDTLSSECTSLPLKDDHENLIVSSFN